MASDGIETEALFASCEALRAAERGLIPREQAGGVAVRCAVDPSSAMTTLPRSLARRLGLNAVPDWRLGPTRYAPVRITILGRSCTLDTWESPADAPPTIGHTVLTHLDLVVDPQSRTLTGNPAHGGEQVYEAY